MMGSALKVRLMLLLSTLLLPQAERQSKLKSPIVTEIVAVSKYHTAEPYHQQ